jgi:glucosamine kinase
MQLAASHIDRLADRLIALGTERLALLGGLAEHVGHWLSPITKSHLVAPKGDALEGALQLARQASTHARYPLLERA